MADLLVGCKLASHGVPDRWDNSTMQVRETRGEAFRNGRPVAAVVVTEQMKITGEEVLTPGSNRISHRQRAQRGPSTIVFEEIYDDAFRASLERLASVAGDLDAKRAMRDSGERELKFDLSLEDERQITGAYVAWPEIGLGEIEGVIFRPAHADL